MKKTIKYTENNDVWCQARGNEINPKKKIAFKNLFFAFHMMRPLLIEKNDEDYKWSIFHL